MKGLKKESGQTSIVVFFLLIVGLAIGMGVSSNYIRTLRMSKEMDLSYRAVAIAEAGVERMLALPYSTLDEYINNNSCGSVCVLEVTDPNNVTSRADISLSHLGSSGDPFSIELTTQDVGQVELSGYPDGANLSVCWDSGSEDPSITGFLIYGSGSTYTIDNYAYNSVISSHTGNGFDTATSGMGFENCFTVTGRSSPVMLRLKAVYSNFTAYVIPASGQVLPSQGILIDSVGQISDTVKTVQVLRTMSAAPVQFDYVLYQRSVSDPLSN